MKEVKKEKLLTDPVVSMMDFDAPKNQIFATMPNHKHIYLKSLEVKPALKFLKDVKQFMQQQIIKIILCHFLDLLGGFQFLLLKLELFG